MCEIQKGVFNFVVVLLQSPIIFSSMFWFRWRKPLIWHFFTLCIHWKLFLFYLDMISQLNKLVLNYVLPCRICKTSATYIVSYSVLKVAKKDFHRDNELGQGGFGVVYKVNLLTFHPPILASLWIYIFIFEFIILFLNLCFNLDE